MMTYQGIYYNPTDEAFLYDNQQPSHKSDLQYQTLKGCNKHIRSPVKMVLLEIEIAKAQCSCNCEVKRAHGEAN